MSKMEIQGIRCYLVTELRENNYKKVVIHVGTNDLFDKTADEILEGMQDIRETCLEFGVETIIFSVIIETIYKFYKHSKCHQYPSNQLLKHLMRQVLR